MKGSTWGSKVAALRAALADGAELTLYELIERMEARLKQIVSKGRLYKQLGVMQVDGEIYSKGRGDKRVYGLTEQQAKGKAA